MIRVFDDADALARAAAEAVVEDAAAAIAARGTFRLALPGGRSPLGMLAVLAAPGMRGRIDWPHAEILFADERAVPPDHPDSNYGAVARAFLEPAGIPPDRVRRMRGEALDPRAEARACEAWYRTPLDLLVLGVGEDGHVASLFPGSRWLREAGPAVIAVFDSPKPPPVRLTIAPRVIAEARRVVVIATGAGKADAVVRACAGEGAAWDPPARLAASGDWFLDRAAASRLPSSHG